MTKEEREERREWRKQATRIRNAYKRLAKAKPSKEAALIRGMTANLISEPVYELSAEDYELLAPLFNTELRQTFTIGNAEFEIKGTLFPVQHLTMGDRHFISLIACTEEERAYYRYRVYKAVLFI